MKTRGALFGLAITGVCLFLAVRNVDLSLVVREMTAADGRLLVPSAFCTLFGYGIRTVRWQQILRPLYALGLPLLFRVLMLGFAANNILPARVGEIIRAYTLARKANVPVSLGLSTVLIERVFDGLTLLILMAIAIRFAPIGEGDERLWLVQIVSATVFLGALVGVILLLVLRERALLLLAWFSRPLPEATRPRIAAIAESFIQGLSCLQSRAVVVRIGVLSLAVWSVEGVTYALTARAFDLGLAPTEYLSAVLFLLVFVNLGIMVPSAPGYIGTYQFFARLALASFAVSPERALGLALVSHAIQYFLVTGVGLVVLWREQLTLGRVLSGAPPLDTGGR